MATYTTNLNNGLLTVRINPKSSTTIVLGFIATVGLYVVVIYFIYSLFKSPYVITDTLRFVIGFVGLLGLSSVYFFAARALLRKMLHEEVLTVTQTDLTLTDKYLFSKKTMMFKLADVEQFILADMEKIDSHPLQNMAGIEIGFRGRDALVQQLTTDGSILLVYKNNRIRFGKNLPSWDVEEIIQIVSDHTGCRFIHKNKHGVNYE
jgi:hypothetical protein